MTQKWNHKKAIEQAKKAIEETKIRLSVSSKFLKSLEGVEPDSEHKLEVSQFLSRCKELLLDSSNIEAPFRDDTFVVAGPGQHIFDWLQSNPETSIPEAYYKRLAELRMIKDALWQLGKIWHPVVKCGPQFRADYLEISKQFQSELSNLAVSDQLKENRK